MLLAAESSNQFRAAVAFGPVISLPADPVELGELRLMGRIAVPFDISRSEEVRLRTALHYGANIQRPTFVIEEAESWPAEMSSLVDIARRTRAPLTTIRGPGGNHFNILYPLTGLVAQRLAADAGPVVHIDLTEADVIAAFNARTR